MVELGLLRSLCVTLCAVAIWGELSLGAPTKSKRQGPDPDKFLEKYGYLSLPPKGTMLDGRVRREAIKTFQQKAHLKVTGDLDASTMTKMAAPRCGVRDVPEGRARRARSFNSTVILSGLKWEKNLLSWKVSNYSPDLPEESQRTAFAQAFNYWADVIPLGFREATGTEADIRIKFAKGEHGDGAKNAFDGPGTILGHAFFPEDGDTHFDEAETWTEGKIDGINLEQVAAHEFGHAIGIGHSEVEDALMNAYYPGYDPNFQLHEDDILGAQALYGPPDA